MFIRGAGKVRRLGGFESVEAVGDEVVGNRLALIPGWNVKRGAVFVGAGKRIRLRMGVALLMLGGDVRRAGFVAVIVSRGKSTLLRMSVQVLVERIGLFKNRVRLDVYVLVERIG